MGRSLGFFFLGFSTQRVHHRLRISGLLFFVSFGVPALTTFGFSRPVDIHFQRHGTGGAFNEDSQPSTVTNKLHMTASCPSYSSLAFHPSSLLH